MKSRDRILAYLQAAQTGVTCRRICDDLAMHEKAVRQVLDHLGDEGLIHSVFARSTRFIYKIFAAASREIVLPDGFALETDAEQPAPVEEGPEVFQILTPAGQWRADHIPAVRSVFDLGVGV